MSAVIVLVPIVIVMTKRGDNICIELRTAIGTEDTADSVGRAGCFGDSLSVAFFMLVHLKRLRLENLIAASAITAHLTVVVCVGLKIDLPDSVIMTECLNVALLYSLAAASAEEHFLSVLAACGLCNNYPSSVIMTESCY